MRTDLIPRSLQIEEWTQLKRLLQACHGRPTLNEYSDEYPLMLNPQQHHHLMVIKDRNLDRLIAHVGALPRTLRLGTQTISAAVIGSVATHPMARGQGLATRTMIASHEHLRTMGVKICFLWSEQRSLYQELGYEPIGSSFLFRVEQDQTTSLPTDVVFQSAQETDPVALWKWICQRTNCLERSQEEHEVLAAGPGMETFIATRGTELVAALLVGKGMDMKDIAHEWIGEPNAVIRLAQWTAKTRGSLGLLTPALPDETTAEALGRGWAFAELPVAQACLLDPDGFLDALKPQLLPDACEWLSSHASRQKAGSHKATTSLIRYLLGPVSLPRQLRGRGLPLPFYIWGLDSM